MSDFVLSKDGLREYHGLTDIPEYRVWAFMRRRCHNPKAPDYPRYGGRGITVDPSWSRFSAFLADMGPRPSNEHSIERLNNNGPYCKNNCIWATRETQARNKRDSRILELDGVFKTLGEWCKVYSIRHTTVIQRLKAGWSTKDALTLPPQKLRRKGIRH